MLAPHVPSCLEVVQWEILSDCNPASDDGTSEDDITRSSASFSTIELNLNVAGKMLLREKADPLRGRACLQQVQERTTGVLVLPFGMKLSSWQSDGKHTQTITALLTVAARYLGVYRP